jgi:hypothetical protein
MLDFGRPPDLVRLMPVDGIKTAHGRSMSRRA